MSADSSQHASVLEITFRRRDRLPLEVEVLRVEELLQRPEVDPARPSRADFHTFLLVEEGTSSHLVDFERYRIGPGDLLVIPERHVQAFDPACVMNGYMALFTARFLEGCGLDVRWPTEASRILLRSGMHLRLGDASFARVRQVFAVLADYTGSPPEQFADEAVASALSLLIVTVSGLPETAASVLAQEPHDELVSRFMELLEARFSAEHQASSYARALHTSLRTLDRHLMDARGQTARQAISSRLVLEAKRLLTRPDVLVKNIAYELGFSEPQNFTRFFRTQTGLSPEAFRTSLDR